MKDDSGVVLSINGREVRITHPDKPYSQRRRKLTKLDLVRYCLSIAPGVLAGIPDRPIVLKRFEDGAEGDAFYQKRAPVSWPSSTWTRIRVNLRNVPEKLRSQQETPDPNDDPTRDWRNWRDSKQRKK